MTPATRPSIRPETPADFAEIHALVKTAFEPAKVSNGDEQNFVDRLRAGPTYSAELALVAVEDGEIVGHVMLTTTAIAFSIATPAQAARLLDTAQFDTVAACSGDQPATTTPGERKDKPAQS